MHRIRLFIMCEMKGLRLSMATIFSSESNFEVLGEAGCDQDSISEAQKMQPDALLCEIKPGPEGLEMVKQIKDVCPNTKVFIFIGNDAGSEVTDAIAAGVDGCLTKTMMPCHLVSTVELTCRAGVFCFPNFLRIHLNKHDIQETVNCQEYSFAGEDNAKTKFPLTSREIELYNLIVQNCSNKEIGKRLFISQPTVKSHISSILRKLGLTNRTEIVLYEMQKRHLINYSSISDTEMGNNTL